MKTCWRIRDLTIFILLALIIPSAPAKEKEQPKPQTPANLVWPLPPDKPRVKFLEMYANNFDIEPKRKQGWMDKMVGNADPNQTEVFYQPAGLAVDSKGQLYIVSTQKGEIYIVNKEKHQVIRMVGDRGMRFQVPIGVAVDAHDNFFVADAKAHAVYKFNPDRTIAGSFGVDALKNPTYISLDEARRRVYVVDTKLHQVLVYNMDSLQLVSTVGKRGEKNGQFNFPIAVAVAPNGNFAVTDTGSCSVQVFDPDYKFLRRIGKQGTLPGQFVRP
ncbi:MAG: hypothetical protein H0X25_09605 [Acidobacteriales bacterium]|nr:hypothetical protein [Terriglobales bacterium]